MPKKRRRRIALASGPGPRSSADPAVAPGRPAEHKPRSGWKRYGLRAAWATVVPVFLLVGLEGVLRGLGYGYPTRFLIPTGDGRTVASNPRFGRQFTRRAGTAQPHPFALETKKPAGTSRIFILGESAAQGTPAPAFGFGRILETMLNREYPERHFEVVNAAMRGINSHVVLPIARECARFDPDLFLVYMGNNELVGLHSPDPTGLNTTPYLRLLRLGQWFRSTRLAQLTDQLIALAPGSSARPVEQDMALFRRSRLAADHPRRAPVHENFRANLTDVCRVTRAAGAKVIVSTVAVNLKDCPPLGSLHGAALAPAQLAAWESAWTRGANAEARGESEEALAQYREALRVDDRFAELHFRLARCALRLGQTNVARTHFPLARDCDALPFRADGRLNQVVRETVGALADPGVFLLDAEDGFAQGAEGEQGIPGSRLFHEHVHFKFDGDHLLARLFFQQIAEVLGLTNRVAASARRPSAILSRQECAEALAFTEWDDISVTAAMLRMVAKPPFLDQVDHDQQQRAAEQTVALRGEVFQKQAGLARAREVYRAALARRPDDWQLHYNFGSLLHDFGDKSGAIAEWSTSVRLMPFFPALHVLLAQTLEEQGRHSEAIQQLQLALRVNPDYEPARQALAHAKNRLSGS